jgi:cytochrome c oxidase subunit 2
MHSAFHPASPEARAVVHLWWWMVGVGGAVWIGVIIAMLVSVRATRAARGADGLVQVSPDAQRDTQRAVAGATFITVLILLGFLAFDFTVGRALARHPARALTIEIVGHQWWWEAQYVDSNPSKRVATANEIHVPVGEPVQLKLSSTDVIHSFWAPNLNGKRDLIPGYVTTQWFTADTAGRYRGQCAEFCGLQHAKMALDIVAEPRSEFVDWLAAASAAPAPLTDSTQLSGRRIFMSGGCAVCHSIGGTDARASVGPTLSHLKSRATIAAGTLANTRENLTHWIANPQAIKPGAHMPASPLTTVQLNALVAFLETLK